MANKALLMTDAPPRLQRGGKALRDFNRGLLLKTLESEQVIRRLSVDHGGRLTLQCEDWESFWLPVARMGEFCAQLGSLRNAWSAYIRGAFARELQRDYCFRYFSLLDTLLAQVLRQPADASAMVALHCTLGFESFGICASGGEHPAAAATCTLRNPTYLLTKLRMPRVPDSAEHLPLVSPHSAEAGDLFYHYRQHRLSRDSDNAVLSYLAVRQNLRPRSFDIVARFEQALSDGTDPFAVERAARLGRSGVLDYLRNWWVTLGTGNALPIDLVDLGAGSGLVAAKLCDEIAKDALRTGYSPRFSIRFVDLSMSRPARFFSSPKLAEQLDSIQAVAMDYRDWLGDGCALPDYAGVRLVLISRFFNNLSDFAIHRFDPPAEQSPETRELSGRAEECAPARCLSPAGPGPKDLVASNARVWSDAGRTFNQASLSAYFRGLRLATGQIGPTDPGAQKEGVYLAVRTFRPECLHTRDGKSILSELARQSELVVVQDADMRPSDLRSHFRSESSADLAAFDTTRLAGLRGHFSYLIGKRSDPLLLKTGGERLW